MYAEGNAMINEQNLNLYKIFYLTATAKSLSLAARKLFISQPAISKSIRKLEDNLGVTLFVRNSKGVTLTEEGLLLFRHVEKAFDALEFGEKEIFRMNILGMKQLRIGVSTTLCKYVLLPYLKDFVNEYPHIKILIQCQSTNHTLKLLEEEKIDIGLIGKPESAKPIEFYSLGAIHDVFVSTKTYLDYLKQRTISENGSMFEAATLMLLDQENMTRQYIDTYMIENRISPNHLLEVSSMDLLIEFANIGIGIGCVIKEFIFDALASGKLMEVPMKIPIKEREIGFAQSTALHSSEAAASFTDYYKKYANPLKQEQP